jgi:hypothetical protein
LGNSFRGQLEKHPNLTQSEVTGWEEFEKYYKIKMIKLGNLFLGVVRDLEESSVCSALGLLISLREGFAQHYFVLHSEA